MGATCKHYITNPTASYPEHRIMTLLYKTAPAFKEKMEKIYTIARNQESPSEPFKQEAREEGKVLIGLTRVTGRAWELTR